MPSRLTGFVCPTVSMVTTGHATGVEKTLLLFIVFFEQYSITLAIMIKTKSVILI